MASRIFPKSSNFLDQLKTAKRVEIKIKTQPLTADSKNPGSAKVIYTVLEVHNCGIKLKGNDSPSIFFDDKLKRYLFQKDDQKFLIVSVTVLR